MTVRLPSKAVSGAVVAKWAALVLAWASVSPAWSLTLGALSVRSMAGQPLQASIEVLRITPEEAATLQLRLASEDTYRSIGAERDPALQTTRLTLEPVTAGTPGSGYVISVVTAQPVSSTFVDLIVEARSSEGRISREYTVLLKGTSPQTASTASAASPTAPAKSPAATAPASPRAAAASDGKRPSHRTIRTEEGETLFAIARREKPDGVTLQQMVDALYHGNPRAFRAGDKGRLLAGSTLTIPTTANAIREAASPPPPPQPAPKSPAVAPALAPASTPAVAASSASVSTSVPTSASSVPAASVAAVSPAVIAPSAPASSLAPASAPRASTPLAAANSRGNADVWSSAWLMPAAALVLGLLLGMAVWAAWTTWRRARRADG